MWLMNVLLHAFDCLVIDLFQRLTGFVLVPSEVLQQVAKEDFFIAFVKVNRPVGYRLEVIVEICLASYGHHLTVI
jgi:hypothetical protein